jgi:50S ribosomal protein L16 3-hydroxylase
MMKQKTYLGGLSPNQFLQRHWQKTPLLIPGALKPTDWILDLNELIELSQSPDCSTRLIIQKGSNYQVAYGPFTKSEIAELPDKNWTLLVQGINHVHTGARKLLELFSFIPFARLDDIMVSYAAPGGNVGPHYDSYDVFLLQGSGSRKWQVSGSHSLDLIPNQELRILKSFVPEGQCEVTAGDILYLPPNFSHYGVALEPCFTYSIGFIAPIFDHVKSEFLHYLDAEFELPGIFQDPTRKATDQPGLIPEDLLQAVTEQVSRIKWTKNNILKFTGEFLTQSAANYQSLPPNILSKKKFLSQLSSTSYQIESTVKFLYREQFGFIGGNAFKIPTSSQSIFRQFANTRLIHGRAIQPDSFLAETIFEWLSQGYVRSIKT